MAALAKLKIKEWPYAGPIGLVEKDDFSSTTDLHVVDHWAYLGTAQREEQVWEILQQQGSRPAAFDQETYRLINKAIAQGAVEVRELTPPVQPA